MKYGRLWSNLLLRAEVVHVGEQVELQATKAYRHAKIEKEAIIEKEDIEPPKHKGGHRSRKCSKPKASSSGSSAEMLKDIRLIPDKCAEVLIEKLSKKGMLLKPTRKFGDQFADDSDEWMRKYKPKDFHEVNSTPLEDRTEVKNESSLTGSKCTKFPNDTGRRYSTPGKGYEADPFIIVDNGSSRESSTSLAIYEFPSVTRTPENENAISGGSSAENSAEVSCPSLNTILKDAITNGTRSMITDYIAEDHIEAARVYIETLTNSSKHRKQTVVYMTRIGGETCTAEMLQAITSREWLIGAVINCYSNHLLSRSPFSNRHVLTSWVSHRLLQCAEGKVNNSNMNYMEYFMSKSKTFSSVKNKYFIKEKAYFPFNVDNAHWITIVMHNTKEEFQVLNSTGKISKMVSSRIVVMRAEIANDIKEVNSALGTDYPDVSNWPIKEYKMKRQHDAVSCGLFLMKCIEYWDGDEWTYDIDQDNINSLRGHILAEILFSESNTLSKVREKILKILDKE
ncbi:hypothetical protein ZWY2020_029247 [Hordeum vulgare]|nr:hypothetical protein ZWY2020_029247 [Hordeum vulgare]